MHCNAQSCVAASGRYVLTVPKRVSARFSTPLLWPCAALAAIVLLGGSSLVWAQVGRSIDSPGQHDAANETVGESKASGDRSATDATLRKRLAERDRLWTEARALAAKNDIEEAIRVAEKVLAIDRSLLDAKDAQLATTYDFLAELEQKREHYDAAHEARAQSLKIKIANLGPKHWQVVDARLALANVEFLAKLDDVQRRQLEEASLTSQKAANLHRQGRVDDAEKLYIEVLQVRKTILGEAHRHYAASLNNLAGFYESMEDFERAEPLYMQTSAIVKSTLGERHPYYAASLNNLARLYHSMGDLARAEPLYKQACKLYKKPPGTEDLQYATSLTNLGGLYRSMGDYARAEPLLKQAVEITMRGTAGSKLSHATSLNSLAGLYDSMRDYARAEPLYKQASEIVKHELGESDPKYATSLNNLAGLYDSLGDYSHAESLYKQAIEIVKKVPGESHPSYATGLNNLALLYQSMGDYERAELLYQHSSEILKKALGETHPSYADSLNNLAGLYYVIGDHARAEPLSRAALRITADQLELAAAVQSERQQLLSSHDVRRFLNGLLAASAHTSTPAAEIYSEVLRWKGSVWARQRSLRAWGQRLAQNLPVDQRDEARTVIAALESAARKLANLTARSERPAAREGIDELAVEVEELQRKLARLSTEYRKSLQKQQPGTAEVAAALPEGSALVDIIEYSKQMPPEPGKAKGKLVQHFAVFLLGGGQSVKRVELGAADPIRKAVMAWRTRFAREKGEETAAVADPGGNLRQFVWDKLRSELGDTKTVIISPDGVFNQLPWGALPGMKPRTYLIEEGYGFVIVPVARQLPGLLAKRAIEKESARGLLLVGDVDYGAAAGVPAQLATATAELHGAGLREWPPLPGTRDEILAVRAVFEQSWPRGTSQTLRQAEATEEDVRRQAVKNRYLHFATHGYFAADPVSRSADSARGLVTRQEAVTLHPSLLTGLVLAGANQPVASEEDDGILTALEVEELDLSGVDLVTLSACQTGLGQMAGAEGVLGLQRAFQVAGAHSAIASLWRVPDRATQALMKHFYDNLWHEKMSALQALREAQLWMLREAPQQPELLRGLELEPSAPDVAGGAKAPPFYWAAFVLSGDWR